MFKFHGLGKSIWVLSSFALLLPATVVSQDRDTQEIQRYVLTDAALAKYKVATTKLAALPPGGCDEDDDTPSIAAVVAKLDAMPAARAAITSAGMTTREYIVFSFSIVHNAMASWALSQPGGTLPPGTSQANVDFIKRHAAEIESLPKASEDACDEEATEDDYTE
ncbi:MAG: hypothetical protein ACT4UQ_01650 [Gammaproteobacteria bacterium]